MQDGVLVCKASRLKIPKSGRVQLSLSRQQKYVGQVIENDHWLISFKENSKYQKSWRVGEFDELEQFEPLAKIPVNCSVRYKILDKKEKLIEIIGVIYEVY